MHVLIVCVCKQFPKSLDALEKHFPGSRLLLLMDQVPFHKCFAEDALVVSDMNVGPDGAQPKMRPGWFVDRKGVRHVQPMVDRKGVAKGMEQVLLERGLLKQGMHGDAMSEVLRNEPDFQSQMTVLQEIAHKRGHRVIYYPKFHAELSALEPCFRSSKRTVIDKGILSKDQLRKAVMPALRGIPMATIRAYFDKCRHFLAEYRKEHAYPEAKADLKATEKQRRDGRREREKEIDQTQDADADATMSDANSSTETQGKGRSQKAKAKARTEPQAHSKAKSKGHSALTVVDSESKSKAKAKAKSKTKAAKSKLRDTSIAAKAAHSSGRSDKDEKDTDADTATHSDLGNGKRRAKQTDSAMDTSDDHRDDQVCTFSVALFVHVSLAHLVQGQSIKLPAGLRNSADPSGEQSQCFMISAVQLLLSVPEFENALLLLFQHKEGLAIASAVTRSLAKLAHALNSRRNQHQAFQSFASASAYTPATRLDSRFSEGQNDSGEFLIALLERLQSDPAIAIALNANPFEDMLKFKCTDKLYCGLCNREWSPRKKAQRVERNVSVSAQTFAKPGQSSMFAALLNWTSVDQPENYKCSKCHTEAAVSKRLQATSAPELLLVSISRLTSSGAKSKADVNIERDLLANPFDARYEFAGAATHLGESVKGGHYIAHGKRNAHWYSFDDHRVDRWDVDSGLKLAAFRQNVTVALFRRTALVPVSGQPAAAEEMDTDSDND